MYSLKVRVDVRKYTPPTAYCPVVLLLTVLLDSLLCFFALFVLYNSMRLNPSLMSWEDCVL